MSYDWSTLDKEQPAQSPQYKTYAPNGEYKVKLEKVEVIDRDGWKSPALTFTWAEDDKHRYCRSVYHWLSIENESYRRGHNRSILMALGIEKTRAEELVDAAEKSQSRDGLKKGYEALYKRVSQRHPETTIVIQDQYRDGKPVIRISEKGTQYTPNESDFSAWGARTMELIKAEVSTNFLDDEEEIDMDAIPFD